MPRFALDAAYDAGDLASLRGADARHIVRVLRLGPGDTLQAAMPNGMWAELLIRRASTSSVAAEVTHVYPSPAEAKRRVELFQGLPKAGVMDAIVEKASELGVSAVVPLATHRSVPRLEGDRERARLERWRRIAAESCKQCGRTVPLDVFDVTDVTGALGRKDAGTWALFAEPPLGGSIEDALEDAAEPLRLVIGPEGGLTDDEREAFMAAGARPVSLGPRILRCETAAIAACALVLHHLGDLQP